MDEIWKDITGYEGLYQVSNLGRVYNLKTKKFVTIGYGKSYPFFNVIKNGKLKHFYIHRIIGEHFISNPDNKPQINHKNGIKSDFRLDNLEWVTRSENAKHSYDVLKYKITDNTKSKMSKSRKGIKHPLSQFTEQQVRIIKWALKFGSTPTDLAPIFNVKRSAIYDIKYNRSWSHVLI